MHIVEKRVGNVIAYNQKPHQIVLIGDRYLFRCLEIENITESNIMLLDGVLSRAYEVGLIIKAGNGDRLDTDVMKTMYFEEGDVVAFERLAGRSIMLGGREHRVVNQAHCFFRFSKDVSKKALELDAKWQAEHERQMADDGIMARDPAPVEANQPPA